MNDKELADLIRRENYSRDVLGYKRNIYVCASCLGEGKSEANSTYLDWPAHYDKESQQAYCSRHWPLLDVVPE